MTDDKNVLGGRLEPCSVEPRTGFFRDGCCNTGPEDLGLHVVCARMTAKFLAYSVEHGNDLSTPQPEVGFPGLKPGVDTYPAGAAQNVIALFSRMGLDQLLLGLLFVLVLFCYRAMIPLMYVLIVVHYIAQEGIVYVKPLALAGTSGASTPALVLTVLSISGLVLSLVGKGYLPGQKSESA